MKASRHSSGSRVSLPVLSIVVFWFVFAATPQTNLAQSCVMPPSGMVSWWLAEGNPNDFRQVNNGVLEGGAGYASGQVGKAFSFDGTGKIKVANSASLNAPAFTIEAWVYPALIDGGVDIIVNKEAENGTFGQYEIGIRGADSAGAGTIPKGNLAFFIAGVSGLPNEFALWVDGGGAVPLFTWTHVALTFDGGSAKAYINGALTRNIGGVTGGITVTSGPLIIGSRSNSILAAAPREGFNGLIDEVAFYNRALSASEIRSIFIAGSLGKCNVANTSAASFREAPLASESIAASFGTGLATATQSATVLPLPTSLAGTTVNVRDSAGTERLAPLFFVSSSQINYQIPAGTATGTAGVAITSGNGAVSQGTVQIEAVSPGLFAANSDGQGVAAAVVVRVKANSTQSVEPIVRFDTALGKFVSVPVDLGPETDQVFLILFGTGIRFRSSLTSALASIGGLSAQVDYAGPAPGFVGLDQVNARLPRSLIGRGEVDVVLMVDGKTANTVRVNIK